ncbi:quercetin -dioxygenase [Colletotrichum truncatum]|uniref:Quercetin -dioxygenase n=1 Tax=Colletotrichum truncatum TaxID=5467 RepID=A0ACC3ZGY1_COLTU|nr:quercetin -dioxygenase [Colletotrichum truncatum]KAF6790560.1 quercetin -dioxygenase [Colletotrichum truncatum]
MKLYQLGALLFYHASLTEASTSPSGNLLVDVAPDYPRPYVLPKFKGRAIKLTKSDIVRFAITTNSSDGAFSMVQHNGKTSGWTVARPHTHERTHEHFYCSRGRAELWAQKNATGANHEARVASLGDYGSAPPGTIHTFQLIDPDTQLNHIFHPGGFEKLFAEFSIGEYNSAVGSPYVPIPDDPEPFGPLTPEIDAQLRSLDLIAAPAEEYIPRRDMINGTAGDAGLNWHDGLNTLPDDPTEPYFVANNYGPIYLNAEIGYKVIQPLVTPTQTDGNFTLGTIIMSPKLENETKNTVTLPHHFALELQEGQLVLSVDGYDTASLLPGDVAFVPANITFSYFATVPFTKFLYMNGGGKGLDHHLLNNSIPWGFPAYPTYAGFTPGQ